MILGIIIGYYINFPFIVLIPIIALLFLGNAVLAIRPLSPIQRNRFAIIHYLFFTALGIFLLNYSKNKRAITQELINSEQYFLVEVKNIPKYTKRIQCEAEIIGYESQEEFIYGNFGRIHLSMEKKAEQINIKTQDQLFIKAKIKPVAAPMNPYSFDFKNFINKKGLNHAAYARANNWTIVKAHNKFSLRTTAHNIQERLAHIFNKYIPEARESAVINALVLGNKSELTPEIRNAYADTGALHVLAVSGLHVGLIFLIFVWISRKITFWWPNKSMGLKPKQFIKFINFIIPFFAIWAFTFIAGASPSVVRASLMLSLILISQLIQRYPSIYNTMTFAAFIMLLINPWQLFNISFQLSFLALLGIIYFQPRIYRSWYIKNWLGDKIWLLVSVGIAAQLGTFPIAIYYFHQFPIYFWLSGIIVVPFATVILGLGLTLLALHFTFSFAAPIVAKLLAGVVWMMNAMIYLIQQIPYATYNGVWIASWEVFTLYLIIILFVVAFSFKNKKLLFSGLSITLALCGFHFYTNYIAPFNHKMIIYHSYGNTRIDYFLGNTCHAFTSENFDEDKLHQLIAPVHEYFGIKNTLPDLPNKFNNSNISGVDFHTIDNQKFAILDQETNIDQLQHLELDYLIIRGNPKIKIEKLLDTITSSIIILDSSNKNWFIDNFKSIVDKKDIQSQVIDITRDGALIIDFEKKEIEQGYKQIKH